MRQKENTTIKVDFEASFEELDTEAAALKGGHSNRDECFEGGTCQDKNGNISNLVETDMTSWEVEIENGGGGRDSCGIDSSPARPMWKCFLFGGWSPNVR